MTDSSLSSFLESLLTPQRLARFDEVLSWRTRYVTVVLENLYHTRNSSACLRNCECFGVQDVHVVESKCDYRPNESIDCGSGQWLTVHRYGDQDNNTLPCFKRLRADGYRILAMTPADGAVSLEDLELETKTAFVFGAELAGLSDDAVAHADACVKVPMHGFTESFNVSVAVALVLQPIIAQLHASPLDWRLTASEQHALRQAWIRTSHGHKLKVLEREFNRRLRMG